MDAHGIAILRGAARALGRRARVVLGARCSTRSASSSTSRTQRILDLSRGPAWPRWCVGGRHEHRPQLPRQVAADRRPPIAPALRWEGEEGTTRVADLPRAACAHQPVRQRAAVAGPRRRAIASRSSCRCARSWWRRSSPWSRSAASCCRSSPATAPTPCRRGSRTSGARFLFTADGFWRRGQRVEMRQTADAAVAASPGRARRGRVRGWATRRRWDRVAIACGRICVASQSDRLRDRAHRRRRPADAPLHLGHHRPARRARCTPTAASRSRRRRT